MRAICKVCQDKDSCSYLKRGRENDCIDVQTSDYGYEEAVEKAAEWIAINAEQCIFDDMPIDEILTEFKKAMLNQNKE